MRWQLQGVSCIILKYHELWSTNGFKLDRHFYPPFENFAFFFVAGLRRRTSDNRTQPNFSTRYSVNHGNKLPQNFWVLHYANIWGQNPADLFSTTSQQLNGNSDGQYLRRQTRASALATTRGLLHCFKMAWTLVHKRLQIGPLFLPTLCKFCFFRNFTATITAYIYGTKHDIENREIMRWNLHGVSYVGSKCHELWSTNGFKLDLHFYPPPLR